MTFPRLYQLGDLTKDVRPRWLYELGAVFNQAMHAPKELAKLLKMNKPMPKAEGLMKIPKKGKVGKKYTPAPEV
jgi:hypothetical protein